MHIKGPNTGWEQHKLFSHSIRPWEADETLTRMSHTACVVATSQSRVYRNSNDWISGSPWECRAGRESVMMRKLVQDCLRNFLLCDDWAKNCYSHGTHGVWDLHVRVSSASHGRMFLWEWLFYVALILYSQFGIPAIKNRHFLKPKLLFIVNTSLSLV